MANDEQNSAGIDFGAAGMLAWLDAACDSALDAAPFGVIRMDFTGVVAGYNATESAASGLPASRVIGRHFFSTVAPCMNNFLVAQRFDTEIEIDDVLDYVLTLRMRPTAVRLRLLKSPAFLYQYVLIERTR
jgi:photoactive yellow protein